MSIVEIILFIIVMCLFLATIYSLFKRDFKNKDAKFKRMVKYVKSDISNATTLSRLCLIESTIKLMEYVSLNEEHDKLVDTLKNDILNKKNELNNLS